MSRPKILIVEDDRPLSDVLQYNFVQAGFDVFQSFDGQDGVNHARLRLPEVIVLDVMIPVLDGIEVCRKLRSVEETKNLLIIMVTAKSEETDQLIGFSVGADDYVVKPFSVKVLLERVKALVRRRSSKSDLEDEIISLHNITVDRIKHKVSGKEGNIDLTPSEFRLLETLIRQPGRAFDRSELIDTVLGEDTFVLERTIDVHVRGLRKKLGTEGNAIETVRGVGYRFKDQ